jgi:hypothetical protein
LLLVLLVLLVRQLASHSPSAFSFSAAALSASVGTPPMLLHPLITLSSRRVISSRTSQSESSVILPLGPL